MSLMNDLLDDVVNRAEPKFLSPVMNQDVVEDHDCHGCGEATPDVDLWAENSATGEELWLCEACCAW